jgi:dTDP-4-dehydrorhamnose reductase
MATILITGANGQLGNELKVASQNFYGYDFIFTDVDTLDLTSPEQTEKSIRTARPDWIVNCAAYNLVDKAETDPEMAMLINATAVKNITDVIKGSECRFIHVSTDYVYEGNSNVPYNENSIPNPLSAYGRSKLAGEKYAIVHPGSMVIRTSWLYSTFGTNFVKTILKYGRERESLRVVYDQTGTPTYAADLAGAIMAIISGVIRNQVAFNAGLYNYSNEGVCTWYDFASEIISEAGLKCQVNPVLTRDYQLPASRPVYSVMDKSKIKENYGLSIPHWRSSLKSCMSKMN